MKISEENNKSFVPCDLDAERLRFVLPTSPGVYLFRDSSGRAVYVGKAKNLRKRVLSYFKARETLPPKTGIMMQKAAGLDFIVTSTENEAFILESNLIRKHMPRYNVILRDDKRYPSLRIDPGEPYPRLSIVRRIKKDGALYYGPFSSANAVHNTLRAIDRAFPLRKCKGRGLPKRSRPCLNNQMGRCLGPCANEVSESAYMEIVKQVRLFLEGRNRELLRHLEARMAEASEHLDFENAAKIRDRIEAIKKIAERQHVVSPKMEDMDVIAVAQEKDCAQAVVLLVRKGAVTGSRDYVLRNQGWSVSEVMESFLKQYYQKESFVPGKILVSEQIRDSRAIEQWLSSTSMKKVEIIRPRKGQKLRMVGIAMDNAKSLLRGRSASRGEDPAAGVKAVLKLKKAPRYIEGFDISNIHGDMAVGCVVSFMDGMPDRAGYRNFRIKDVEGIDDYGMMAELVSRRVDQGSLPDLFLVDGGKGHLSSVKRVLDRMGCSDTVEVAAIAKPDENMGEKYDRIYIPGRKNAIKLVPDHPVLHLMMRIRDEAHRRAVEYHRKLRSKRSTESVLDHIPGIGDKRKRILLNYFNDINSISRAGFDALAAVPGIGRSVAAAIEKYFEKNKPGL